MEIENFEEELMGMTKPNVSHLKHQDMLANVIINAKDKSVVSWWWLSVPLYIIAMLLMKSVFMPHTTLVLNIEDLKNKQTNLSILFLLIVPIVLIVINLLSIRKIHFLSGSPKSINFLHAVWLNVLMIIFAIIILIIYLL